jgi:hypothetical protein
MSLRAAWPASQAVTFKRAVGSALPSNPRPKLCGAAYSFSSAVRMSPASSCGAIRKVKRGDGQGEGSGNIFHGAIPPGFEGPEMQKNRRFLAAALGKTQFKSWEKCTPPPLRLSSNCSYFVHGMKFVIGHCFYYTNLDFAGPGASVRRRPREKYFSGLEALCGKAGKPRENVGDFPR